MRFSIGSQCSFWRSGAMGDLWEDPSTILAAHTDPYRQMLSLPVLPPPISQSPTHSPDDHTNSAIQTIFSTNLITSSQPSPPSTSIPGVRSRPKYQTARPPLTHLLTRPPPPPPRQVIPPSSMYPERSKHPSYTHLIPQVTQHAPHNKGHSTTQVSRCIQNTLRMWKSLHRGNRQRHEHTTQKTQY